MSFDRDRMKVKAAELAAKGDFIGTSSRKYEGWFGQLCTPVRYEYRGKVAKTRFQRDSLSEYAEVFKTVCADAAYYDFPRREYLQGLADQVPEDFRFGLKVTDGDVRKALIFINNRLERNALNTIAAILGLAEDSTRPISLTNPR